MEYIKQESRAVARKPRYAAVVLFGLKFTDNIQYKFKSSRTSKVRLQSSKHNGAKQNLTQNGHARSKTGRRMTLNGHFTLNFHYYEQPFEKSFFTYLL